MNLNPNTNEVFENKSKEKLIQNSLLSDVKNEPNRKQTGNTISTKVKNNVKLDGE